MGNFLQTTWFKAIALIALIGVFVHYFLFYKGPLY